MKIAVVDVTESKAYLMGPEIEYGLCDYLLGVTRRKSSLRKRNMRVYGCRHCLPRPTALSTDTVVSDETAASGEAVAKKALTKVNLMSFDSLRSHLKSR